MNITITQAEMNVVNALIETNGVLKPGTDDFAEALRLEMIDEDGIPSQFATDLYKGRFDIEVKD